MKQQNLRVMFIVQGEGRGHLTQAISLAEILTRHGHQVIEVLVGTSRQREIPDFFKKRINAPIKNYEAPSFIFRKNKKHIHIFKTIIYNLSPKKLSKYAKSIELMHQRVKKNAPDIIINFYEILPGFMHLRFRQEIPFINIGHQYLLRHPDYTPGKGDSANLMLLRLHAFLSGVGASKILALSFYPMRSYKHEHITVIPPLLRKEVLELKTTNGNYILGYILNQGFENEVREWHQEEPTVSLHFFWDKKDAPETLKIDDTCTFHLIDDKLFLEYMANCSGYITTAGFESVCEALYLNKPVMMIPAHIEQEVNAADALSIQGGIVGDRFDISRLLDHMESGRTFDNKAFKSWVDSAEETLLNHLKDLIEE